MKKQDMIPVAILFILLLAYPTIDEKYISKLFPPKAKPVAEAAATEQDMSSEATWTQGAGTTGPEAAAAGEEGADDGTETAATDAIAEGPREKAPEQLRVLTNGRVELTASSHGAGFVRATMLEYPEERGSENSVVFDFSDRPAAAPIGYPGLAEKDDFQVADASERAIEFRKTLPGGLRIRRTLELGDGFQVRIRDEIHNESTASIALKGYGLQSGFMSNLAGEKDDRTPLLGIDTLTGSDSVKYWSGKFSDWFPQEDRRLQQQYVPGPKKAPEHVDWVAVKNKYFAQILTPENPAERCRALAARGEPTRSSFMFLFPRTDYPFERIAAAVEMPDFELAAGQTIELNATWYAGPKVYAELKANGPHQEDVLELGFWRPIGILILKVMVWIQAKVWPYNYGLAIILLTFMIRVVFWPLNHKSMVSTRHMQEVQPLIAALKEKYKGDPQRQQQEMMALYKEHKINPMGGCLPMLIQIPVFFALFVVLRGAIELRFSSFLWIADLSTPENLFKDVLPIAVNVLPIFMGVTMWIQQKLTPAGDAQQQRMMMMMPVIFTVMFYSFPSGLSLYWSTNQVLMIVQLAWMRKHHRPVLKK